MAEGGSADGAFLVAADGLWSRLRALLAPGARLEATGVTAARCVLAMDAAPRRFHAPATGIWLAPDSHVVHYPVAGGRSLSIVAIAPVAATASGWNSAVDAATVIARFPHLPPALAELFERAETWRQWGLMRGGMTFRPEGVAAGASTAPAMLFLGDAAHPIQPFLAQGGAMAIEDAAVFADLFAAGPDAGGPPSECTVDADCNDGDYCNGVETCDTGTGCLLYTSDAADDRPRV